MVDDIGTVFRDFNNINDPASGDYEPEKARIRKLLRDIEARSGLVISRSTLAALNAVAATTNYRGIVFDDPNPSNNGYYYASGGAWVFGRGFPDTFAALTLAGPANAQTGSVNAGVAPSEAVVFFALVTTANTSSMTLSIDGETPRDVVSAAGTPLAAGQWSGAVTFFLNSSGDYQLLFDSAAASSAASSAAAADASRILAEAAAAQAAAAVTYTRVVVRFTTSGVGPYDMGVGNTIGSPNNLDVKLGGVIQDHNTYTVSGTTFTFTADPGSGLAMEAVLQGEARSLNAPADGSVTEETLDPALTARLNRIITAQDYGAVFDDSTEDRAKIKEAALAAAAAGVPFVVPNVGLDRATGLVIQVPEDFTTIQEAHDAMLNWIFPGARPKTIADAANHVPQVAVTISVSGAEHLLSGTNITWNHPNGDQIRVPGRGRVALTLASQQDLTYSSGVHFLKLRFSTWPATDPVVGRALRIILAPGSSSGSGEYLNFDGVWRITAVDAVNKDITVAVYAKTDTSLLTAIVSAGIFIYLPTQVRGTNIPYSDADVGIFDVHTVLRLADMSVSGNASGTNGSSTNGIVVREGAKLLLDQYVGVLECQRSGLWVLNSGYAQVGYAAFCGNDSGINCLQSVVDGTNASVQGNASYGFICGIGSSTSLVVTAYGGCGITGIFVGNGGSFIGSGHSRRSQYGIDCKPMGHANINDMQCISNTVFDVRRRGGGQIMLTANNSGSFDPPLDTGDSYGGFTALSATLEAVT